MLNKRVRVFLINAFSKNGQGGNPAGVVLNANELTVKDKQLIAKQVNFSETAFISNRYVLSEMQTADFDVSFFTPTQEVDFCGHATLAAFACLLEQKIITPGAYIQSTHVGELEVLVSDAGLVTMGQRKASYHEKFQWHEILPLLILPSDLKMATSLPIEVVSTGLKDCIIPLPKGVLNGLSFDLPAISDFCKRHELIGFHLFELDSVSDNSLPNTIKAQCRNIAPAVGIDEESATGSSSGALACYLNKHLEHKPMVFEFEQGRKMGCLSVLSVTLKTENLLNTEKNTFLELTPYVSGLSSIIGIKEITL